MPMINELVRTNERLFKINIQPKLRGVVIIWSRVLSLEIDVIKLFHLRNNSY